MLQDLQKGTDKRLLALLLSSMISRKNKAGMSPEYDHLQYLNLILEIQKSRGSGPEVLPRIFSPTKMK